MNYTNPQKQLIERHQKKSKNGGRRIQLLILTILLGTTGALGYNAFVEPLPDWGLNFAKAGVVVTFFFFLCGMLFSGLFLIISFVMAAISSDDDNVSLSSGIKPFEWFTGRLIKQNLTKHFYVLVNGTLLVMMVANGYIWTTGFMAFFWLASYVMARIERGLRNHYISELSLKQIEHLEEALARNKADGEMEKGLSELEKKNRKEAKEKMRLQGCKQEDIDAYEERIKKVGEVVDRKTTI